MHFSSYARVLAALQLLLHLVADLTLVKTTQACAHALIDVTQLSNMPVQAYMHAQATCNG